MNTNAEMNIDNTTTNNEESKIPAEKTVKLTKSGEVDRRTVSRKTINADGSVSYGTTTDTIQGRTLFRRGAA